MPTLINWPGVQPFTPEEFCAGICKDSFVTYVKEFWEVIPKVGLLDWNWHIKVFCDELSTLAHFVYRELCKPAGQRQRRPYDYVCNVPPGMTKSIVHSICFPTWVWTWWPAARFICGSHTDELVLDLALSSREIIKSDKYRSWYPNVQLRRDMDAKGNFGTTAGGERKACTVQGKSPTGRHAHFLIVDDPLNPKTAASEAELRNAEHFMTQVIPDRKVDKRVCPTILVMQRLHVNDPTWVMEQISERPGAVPIRKVCLPCRLTDKVYPEELKKYYIQVNEQGIDPQNLLDPARLPEDALAEKLATLTPYGFNAQFLQDPQSMGSGMFKELYFSHHVKAAPYNAERVRYWDLAASDSPGSCHTAGLLLARDSKNDWFVEHVTVGHWEPRERLENMKAVALRDRGKYGPRYEPDIVVEHEGGSSGIDAYKYLAAQFAGFRIHPDRPSGSKVERAKPWASQLAAGNVYLVEDGSWDLRALIQEYIMFPGGKLKDRVDAGCLLAGTIVETGEGPRAIERVQAGDFVFTRKGLQRVYWSGQTKIASEIISVVFSNGAILSGTVDHLVWTRQRGYIRLDSLEVRDRLYSFSEAVSCQEDYADAVVKNQSKQLRPNICKGTEQNYRIPRQSLSTGLPIIGDQEDVTFRERGGKSLCTEPSGNSIMEIYPLAAIYTTKTTTGTITRLKILNVLPRKSMDLGIAASQQRSGDWLIWNEFGARPKNGTALLKEGNGIGSMASARWRSVPPGNSLALNVLGNFYPRSTESNPKFDSALPYALTVSDTNRESICVIRRFAASAGLSSRAASALSTVHITVREKLAGPSGGLPVYDITVENCHEFFANDLLVHNSGAFNWLLAKKPAGTVYIYQGRKRDKTKPRILVCSAVQLANLLIEEKALWVSISDPERKLAREVMCNEEEMQLRILHPAPPQGFHVDKAVGTNGLLKPPHGFTKLLDWCPLQFVDLDPQDLQERWDQPLPPWHKLPQELVMTRDQGRKLWGFLTKNRQEPVGCYVFQDEGDNRAAACALAYVKIRGWEPNVIEVVGTEETLKEPVNSFVYDLVKATRGMVV